MIAVHLGLSSLPMEWESGAMINIHNHINPGVKRTAAMTFVGMILIVWIGLVLTVGWSVRGVRSVRASMSGNRGITSDRSIS